MKDVILTVEEIAADSFELLRGGRGVMFVGIKKEDYRLVYDALVALVEKVKGFRIHCDFNPDGNPYITPNKDLSSHVNDLKDEKKESDFSFYLWQFRGNSRVKLVYI